MKFEYPERWLRSVEKMVSSSVALTVLFIAAVTLPVDCSIPTIIGLYGKNIEVPCNNGEIQTEDPMFTKWKYEADDGTPGDLLIKQFHKVDATIQATGRYKDRVSISHRNSLVIAQGSLEDQRIFTCMLVWQGNVKEYQVQVLVHKRPSPPQIQDKADKLEIGKLTKLGECVAKDANPPANITWTKNGLPLLNNDRTIKITERTNKNPVSGLSSTSSVLEYMAGKDDVSSRFICEATHMGVAQHSPLQVFTIHYPTENVNLQILNTGVIKEGDNVTLRCHADGNPPPSTFIFYTKGKQQTVNNNDTLVLTSISRMQSGEYRCALPEDESKQDSKHIQVHYLDLSVIPSGSILRNLGDNLVVLVEKNASGEAVVTWTKDQQKLDKQPSFTALTYADAGQYMLEVSVAGIMRSHAFQLDVQGKPLITHLTESPSPDGNSKVLSCEADGSPEPSVQWSINGTNEKTSYNKGKVIHRITVVPSKNLTVLCTVTNSLGDDSRAIYVPSDRSSGNDQAKLIVGIVVGLILAAATVGLIYWLYMKNSRQGSWKTREKETGTCEEEKKLEENNHKADV